MILLPLCLLFVPCIDCYCKTLGANPDWKSAPMVEQISLTKVRVSWRDIIIRKDCADNFLVKYWPVMSPHEFTMTSPMSTDTLEIDISDIRSRREYEYQVKSTLRELFTKMITGFHTVDSEPFY